MRSRRYVINRVGLDGKAGSIPGVTPAAEVAGERDRLDALARRPPGPRLVLGSADHRDDRAGLRAAGAPCTQRRREGSASHPERLTIVPLGRTSPPRHGVDGRDGKSKGVGLARFDGRVDCAA